MSARILRLVQELRLSIELHDRLVSIARAMLPNEACGLIGGTRADDLLIVTSVHAVTNEKAAPTAFALDGQGMIDAENRIDAAGDVVLGVWHSHPASSAVPSATDLADAAIYDPGGSMLQVLVSMQGFAPQVRAYRYGAGDEPTLRKYWLVRIGS